MAAVGTAPLERRRTIRLSPAVTPWRAEAVLRPGRPVVVLNLSNRGALVESDARLRPGTRTELQLAGVASRRSVRARVERCHIATLEPLCYRGAILFEEDLELERVSGSE